MSRPTQLVARIAAVASVLVGLGCFGQTPPVSEPWRLYYDDLSISASPTRSLPDSLTGSAATRRLVGLKFQLFYCPETGGTTRPSRPDRIFNYGDRLKIQIEPNIEGFLYIWQEGSSGNPKLLFPDERINRGLNQIRSWQKMTVPAEGWWQIEGPPGNDHTMIILCRTPVPSLTTPGLQPQSLGSLQREIPADNRDFELVSDRPDLAAGGIATIVVNRNVQRNSCVFYELVVRHR